MGGSKGQSVSKGTVWKIKYSYTENKVVIKIIVAVIGTNGENSNYIADFKLNSVKTNYFCTLHSAPLYSCMSKVSQH